MAASDLFVPQARAVGLKADEDRVVSEGLLLRAWTVRGDPHRPVVVVAHGVGDTLESFTGVAYRLNARGHTVLLLDLRGHGGSEGRYTTLGAHEREDVRAAMRDLRGRALAPSGFILMGFSMGAAAVLRAAAEERDVRAVVLEAPFDTYRETVAHHGKLLYGIPRWLPLAPAAVAVAEWRAGFDADEVDLVAAAARTRAALLAIADGVDERMPEAVVRRVYDAHPGPKQFWLAPGAGHVVTTMYGHMLWRLKNARLTHGIRAVLWHQGEADQGSDGPDNGYGWVTYQPYFVDMSAAWKQDMPNIRHYYVFQIWPNGCSQGNGHGDMLREKQRTLPRLYSNMDVMSTLGIKPGGGCHYRLVGWSEFSRLMQPLIERHSHGKVPTAPITAPNLKQAYYATSATDAIALEFDRRSWDTI